MFLIIFPSNIRVVVAEEGNKITTIIESGEKNSIQWKVEDWYYPKGLEPLPDSEGSSLLNGTIFSIEGSNFRIIFDTEVSNKTSTQENYTKRSDQIHFQSYGQDDQWHQATLNFRGLWLKINSSVESNAVLQDDHGEFLLLANFNYSNMKITEQNDCTIFNWNITYSHYILNNTEGTHPYYGSWINATIYKMFYLNVSEDEVELNTDYFMDIHDLKLENVVSDAIAVQFGHVYICSEYAETNNTERFGNYYSSGIKTSTFILEDNYITHYNDSSSEEKTVNSLIINDATINGQEELTDFWHFFIWFNPIGENVTRIDYDPKIKMFIHPISSSNPPPIPGFSAGIIFTAFGIIGIFYFLYRKKVKVTII
ncbi:MAG: hypothetical protein EAX96_10370 [Candidatus Lokiarchaeota archaeon]|nr:hypothetical protein [Candidatus Lokiarchaeota archaeon]